MAFISLQQALQLRVEHSVVNCLAAALHRNYRAAEKALNGRAGAIEGKVVKLRHDHGWAGCHRQKYFLKRAERTLEAVRNAVTDNRLSGLPERPYMRNFRELLAAPPALDIEWIASMFQVPLHMISGVSDAYKKAERDALVRKTLWSKQPKYTVTNAISGPQNGRGLR